MHLLGVLSPSLTRKTSCLLYKVFFIVNQLIIPHFIRTIEESDGFIRDIQKIGKFGTVRIDRVESSHLAVESAHTTPALAESSPKPALVQEVESGHPPPDRVESIHAPPPPVVREESSSPPPFLVPEGSSPSLPASSLSGKF